jgi:hypothetical protein
MDKELVEEYLNKNSHIIDERVVVKGCIDKGHFVTVYAEWESEEGLKKDYLDISIFDLMVFIYSKIQ